jgi:hypothetical protein
MPGRELGAGRARAARGRGRLGPAPVGVRAGRAAATVCASSATRARWSAVISWARSPSRASSDATSVGMKAMPQSVRDRGITQPLPDTQRRVVAPSQRPGRGPPGRTRQRVRRRGSPPLPRRGSPRRASWRPEHRRTRSSPGLRPPRAHPPGPGSRRKEGRRRALRNVGDCIGGVPVPRPSRQPS